MRSSIGRTLVQLAGRYGDRETTCTQALGQGLAHGHGTVLAAGASERDGHIVLVFLRITFDGDGDGFLVGVKELLRASLEST